MDESTYPINVHIKINGLYVIVIDLWHYRNKKYI